MALTLPPRSLPEGSGLAPDAFIVKGFRRSPDFCRGEHSSSVGPGGPVMTSPALGAGSGVGRWGGLTLVGAVETAPVTGV
jgi:hypothetical protein